MKIYKWGNISMKYAGYLGVTEMDERKLCWDDELLGDPLPALSEWKAPTLTQYLGEGKKKRKPALIGDCPSTGLTSLVSQRAADALRDIWDRHASLYPVILDDAPDIPYYMVVVQTKMPFEALDRERSTGKLTNFGPNAGTGLFSVIERWEFNEEIIGDNDMFYLPDGRTTTYVSERFKQRVVEAGLKGFCFRERHWEENPFIT